MAGKPTHGLSRTPEYRCWQTMRLRCNEPSNPAYKDYGARGITVCDRWLESPVNFLADMGLKPSPAHELDRRDNDQGYSKDNCRWVTRSVNDRNRRSNRMIDYLGETQALATGANGSASRAIPRRSGWMLAGLSKKHLPFRPAPKRRMASPSRASSVRAGNAVSLRAAFTAVPARTELAQAAQLYRTSARSSG